jgi:GntR family transcriptional repressor for pyruvate dehydrogenase complex
MKRRDRTDQGSEIQRLLMPTIEASGASAIPPRKRLYEEVERRIENEITSGRLRAGDLMPSERDLMEHYGVGRPAIREALLSLARRGLVRVAAGERTRVSRPTIDAVVRGVSGPVSILLSEPQGIRDLQHARRFFECALVRHAAQEARRADIDRLRMRLEANRASLGDSREFERTDVEFHFELATITGNPIFTALHQATVGWLLQQRTVSLKQSGALRTAFKFHQRIFEAVDARDSDEAEKAMREHLLSVERYYWRSASSER